MAFLDRCWPVDTVKKFLVSLVKDFLSYEQLYILLGRGLLMTSKVECRGCIYCVGLVVWVQCQPQTVQIAASQVTQKTQAVLILLQILQYLPLTVLNPVNLTLKPRWPTHQHGRQDSSLPLSSMWTHPRWPTHQHGTHNSSFHVDTYTQVLISILSNPIAKSRRPRSSFSSPHLHNPKPPTPYKLHSWSRHPTHSTTNKMIYLNGQAWGM